MRIIQVYRRKTSAEDDVYVFENGDYNDYYETILWLCACPYKNELKSIDWNELGEHEKMLVRDEVDSPFEWSDTFNYMWEVANENYPSV